MRSIFPRRMSGEALTIYSLLRLDLFEELLQGHLASRDPASKKLLKEVGTAETRNLGRPLLRDEALRIPLDAGGGSHLLREFLGGEVERRKGARR
jgi:hypothetical protein